MRIRAKDIKELEKLRYREINKIVFRFLNQRGIFFKRTKEGIAEMLKDLEKKRLRVKVKASKEKVTKTKNGDFIYEVIITPFLEKVEEEKL